jgi:osmotically-inducible protein OsmY
MDYMGGGSSIELWFAESQEPGLGSELQRRVKEEMRREAGLDPSGIAVEVCDRTITLQGHVRSYPEKVAAERAAARVPRLQQLINRLHVELATGDERPDAVLADESARVLSWDALVPAGQVRVTVADGCITLEGQVDRAQQREAAEQAVQPLIGVKHVENRITIRPMWTSQELQPEIVLALQRHRELHTRRVRVDVRGGIVVLRGRVPSIAERSAIEHAMWSIAGVTGVVDELTIAR